MVLQRPPKNFKNLYDLVIKYNSIPEADPVQRIFYLQKINDVLHRTSLDTDLFVWLDNAGKDGWSAQLKAYKINPDASIFLKGIQFAQAVASHVAKPATSASTKNEYELMQERDEFLKNASYDSCREGYIRLCHELSQLAASDERIKNIIKQQNKILLAAKAKFEAIKCSEQSPMPEPQTAVRYATKELGTQVNNFNFKFTMTGWDQPFVFRVEDRPELGLELNLHSFPVAKYFIEDFAVFMWGFKDKDTNSVEYKPVVLSQFANQGNLEDVARRLMKERKSNIAPIIGHYFEQLTDFTTQLIAAKTYAPDIKLANFLVNNNRILVSDRKTFIDTENTTANQLRSTPLFAPEEYNACVTKHGTFNYKGMTTKINLPQFMAYQLGMALKEFMILTQQDDITADFNDHDLSAASYFTSPNRSIINLSTLVQELTRENAQKRMTIKQFQYLLMYRNLPTEDFYKKIEEVLPSEKLGIKDDLAEIDAVLKSKLTGMELLKTANPIFKKISANEDKEPRLTRMAEKLAEHCFTTSSFSYFSRISASIEQQLLAADWKSAPWYRKLFHTLTFGYFRVQQVTSLAAISIDEDLRGEEFQTHFPQLEYTSHSVLARLGKTQAMYFKAFMMCHLDKILPGESESPVVSGSSSKALSSDSSVTLVVNYDTVIKTENDAEGESPVQSDTMVISKTVVIDSDNAGIKVHTDNDNDGENHDAVLLTSSLSPSSNKLLFFAKQAENQQKTGKKFGTFRTTMFRGDGSFRALKPVAPKPKTDGLFDQTDADTTQPDEVANVAP